MTIIKHNHLKNRYIVVGLFFGKTPSYGYTLSDAKQVEKLAKRIDMDKIRLNKLWKKAQKQDKRYN